MATNGGATFLPALAKSFDKINDEQSVSTADFAAACERILPIFDHLGRHQEMVLVDDSTKNFVYVWACPSKRSHPTLLATAGSATFPVYKS